MDCRYLANKLLPYFRFDPSQFINSKLSVTRRQTTASLTYTGGGPFGQSCDILVDAGICVFDMPDLGPFTITGSGSTTLSFNLPDGFACDIDPSFSGVFTREACFGNDTGGGTQQVLQARLTEFTPGQIQISFATATGGTLAPTTAFTLFSHQFVFPVKRIFY